VTSHLAGILPQFDLIVGTEEEFMIAGGGADIMASLRAAGRHPGHLVVKRGPLGSAVIDSVVPQSLDDAYNYRGVRVEVLNVLGAGDAFCPAS
jgi:5-dehydro-2-deoxygluconokinase